MLGIAINKQNIALSVVDSVRVTVAGFTGDEAEATSVYCATFTVGNIGPLPMKIYMTILPVAEAGQLYSVSGLITVYPVPLGGDGENLYFYVMRDINGDGVIDLGGVSFTNPTILASVPLPTCREIYLNFLGDSVPAAENVSPDLVILSQGISLADITPDNIEPPYVPFWVIDLAPGESETFQAVIVLDDPANPGLTLTLDYATLAIGVKIDNEVWTALTINVAAKP